MDVDLTSASFSSERVGVNDDVFAIRSDPTGSNLVPVRDSVPRAASGTSIWFVDSDHSSVSVIANSKHIFRSSKPAKQILANSVSPANEDLLTPVGLGGISLANGDSVPTNHASAGASRLSMQHPVREHQIEEEKPA